MSTLPPEPVVLLGTVNLIAGLYSLITSARNSAATGPELPALAPSVTLFVPCCGDEPGLEDNLDALLTQSYPDYRVRLIVEHEADSAVPVVRRCLARHPGTGGLVVAGAASEGSQKVHNLLAAVSSAAPTDVWAFADSDGRPDPSWLGHLVAAVERPRTGVASSYRFYVPEPARFTTFLRSVWNLSVASLLGEHGRNFAWGGAMAIRRDVFERIGVAEAWRGALSDDYAMTHAVRRAGLRVTYTPAATVDSFGDVGLLELSDWCTRQIRITRVYWPRLFRIASASHLAYAAFLGLAPFAGLPGLGLLTGVLLVGVASGALRARRAGVVEHRWAYALLVPLASLLTAQGVVRALVSRRIAWRGKVYEMHSPTKTVIVSDPRLRKDARPESLI